MLQRVLRNILAAPGEAKYRRLRLRNKRIQEAVVDVAGGVELLQVGASCCGLPRCLPRSYASPNTSAASVSVVAW